MDRNRRLLLALILALGLTTLDPSLLDALRYPVALVASWPARVLAGLVAPEARSPESLAAETAAVRAALVEVFPDPDLYRVFHVDPAERLVFLVGGWEQGITRGDRVLAGEALVGFVERVEARWCRVQTLGHRRMKVSGLVALEQEDVDRGLVGELLLAGSGGAEMIARQGSRIDPALTGREVFAPDPEDARPRWSIGRIERDDRLDLVVVRCLLDLEALEDLRVLGRAGGGRLASGQALDALVLAEGGGSTEPRTLLIGRGRADGVRVDSWVSQGGRLLGQVSRAGPYSARVLGLEDLEPRVPALSLADGRPRAFVWETDSRGEGPGVTRGRSLDAAMPRGLLLPGRGESRRRPVVGERVVVHVAAEPTALLRLRTTR